MTAEISETRLADLLHRPPARPPAEAAEPHRQLDPLRSPGLAGLVEPSGPGRQGGPALALLGTLFALAGVPLLLAGPTELARTAVTLLALGAAQVLLGLRLAERGGRSRWSGSDGAQRGGRRR